VKIESRLVFTDGGSIVPKKPSLILTLALPSARAGEALPTSAPRCSFFVHDRTGAAMCAPDVMLPAVTKKRKKERKKT